MYETLKVSCMKLLTTSQKITTITRIGRGTAAALGKHNAQDVHQITLNVSRPIVISNFAAVYIPQHSRRSEPARVVPLIEEGAPDAIPGT